jgi:hypothetical protein
MKPNPNLKVKARIGRTIKTKMASEIRRIDRDGMEGTILS